MYDSIVPMVVQYLLDHGFLDTKKPFNFFHSKAINITEIWDTFLEVTRDTVMRHGTSTLT